MLFVLTFQEKVLDSQIQMFRKKKKNKKDERVPRNPFCLMWNEARVYKREDINLVITLGYISRLTKQRCQSFERNQRVSKIMPHFNSKGTVHQTCMCLLRYCLHVGERTCNGGN